MKGGRGAGREEAKLILNAFQLLYICFNQAIHSVLVSHCMLYWYSKTVYSTVIVNTNTLVHIEKAINMWTIENLDLLLICGHLNMFIRDQQKASNVVHAEHNSC